ncbi:TolC family protein [Mucilaginibacter myungsuensis]|uniref:TolC family protein n=1 Tax=Mucilaginibacter myungsuensis TaxID=649104 RepID=A0A929PXB5_9SPHI|nr:TolC family protein [Mucilaginibacter myungsuensis]MBE9662062.1 TolC family protein [Mucilaginibacter myungsuensis]MDN3599505.1 TolC family protein [Mucilaginibacter myungsuensis]
MSVKYKLIITILISLFTAGQLSAQVLGGTRKDGDQESMFPDFKTVYLQKLIDTADKYYPQIKLRAEQIKIAQTSYSQSKAAWFEGLSVTPSYVYNPSGSINLFNSTGASTNFFNGYQIAFSLSLSSFITRPYITRNAKHNIVVAQMEEETAKLTLRTQVSTLYVQFLQTQSSLRVAAKTASDTKLYLEQVKHDFSLSSPTATTTVYNSALTAYNSSALAKVAAEGAFLTAKLSLEVLVGRRLEDIK